MRAATLDPRLQAAARALCANDLPLAEHLLRGHLRQVRDDSAALRMLAEVGGRLGRYEDALAMLDHAIALSPGFTAARFNRALALYRLRRPVEALEELDRLLDADPDDAACSNLKAAALTAIGEMDGAIASFQAALARRADQPRIWMSYGHALKTVGRQADSVAAYRQALSLAPGLGEAWWSLANLKTVRLDADDLAAMTARLGDARLSDEDRFHLHFALGKGLEDAGDYAAAFAYYADGNRLRRSHIEHDADAVSAQVATLAATITPAFLHARRGQGCAARDPIFVLGMPRAGSTLVEQILASHPLVEGTQELPDIQALVRRETDGDPRRLADLSPERLRALGEEYLDRTHIQRRSTRPLFIDKMPNNWLHVPFIHLILPNAAIVDARRHPIACCFSNFKQHFARGQAFSYDLVEMARYYADYAAAMDHVDAVLPGRVHRIFYESMVADTEREVRRLLDHLGLEFDPACLRFHETARAVRTASSEQVRRPIFREGLDQWRRFEPWLQPLRDTLGRLVDGYPIVT